MHLTYFDIVFNRETFDETFLISVQPMLPNFPEKLFLDSVLSQTNPFYREILLELSK